MCILCLLWIRLFNLEHYILFLRLVGEFKLVFSDGFDVSIFQKVAGSHVAHHCLRRSTGCQEISKSFQLIERKKY